jgi:HEPN domain-containing protein
VEKAIKVALVLHGIEFPKTHDLDFLLARLDGRGLPFLRSRRTPRR